MFFHRAGVVGGGQRDRPVAAWLWAAAALVTAVAAWGEPAPARHGSEEAAMTKTTTWTSLGLGGGGAMFTPAISPADPNLILVNCDMSGAYRSFDGGQTWEMIHYRQLIGSTRVRPVWHPTDPTTAFAAGGWRAPLKVTHDKGKTWSVVSGAPAGITALAVDPGDPQRMLVGSRSGISRSLDGGQTWEPAVPVAGRPIGFHFDQTSPVDTRTCFAATDQRVFRSDDAGATWHAVGRGLPHPLVSFAGGSNRKSESCVLYCSAESGEANGELTGGIYRSDDRGENWARVMGEGIDLQTEQWEDHPSQPAQYEFVLTTDVDPSRVYVSRGWGGRVFRSDDRGGHWRNLLFQHMDSPDFNVGPNYLIDERGGGGDTISGFGIDPADPNHVIVTDWMNCFITKDGGKTWASAHTRSAEPAGRRGTGMRWIDTGLVVTTAWHYYLDPFEPNRQYIAYTDIGYARSTDAGKTWYWQTGRPLRNTAYEIAFDPDTPGKLWAAFADLHDIPNANVISGRHYFANASGGVGVSTDFGVTWRDTSQGLPPRSITSVIVDPKSPKRTRTLYASAFEDGVYKSTDGGQTWVRKSQGLGAPGVNMRVCRLILHPDGTLFCAVTGLRKDDQFVAEGPGLYRSTDGAETWQQTNRSQPLLWPKDYDVDPRDSRVIYLGAADAGDQQEGGLYKTVDGGATWTRVARKGHDCFGASINPRRPDWVYLCIAEGADDAGLWLSTDAGKTWRALEGLPFHSAQRVTFDPRDDSVIYVATFGGSVWRGPAE